MHVPKGWGILPFRPESWCGSSCSLSSIDFFFAFGILASFAFSGLFWNNLLNGFGHPWEGDKGVHPYSRTSYAGPFSFYYCLCFFMFRVSFLLFLSWLSQPSWVGLLFLSDKIRLLSWFVFGCFSFFLVGAICVFFFVIACFSSSWTSRYDGFRLNLACFGRFFRVKSRVLNGFSMKKVRFSLYFLPQKGCSALFWSNFVTWFFALSILKNNIL